MCGCLLSAPYWGPGLQPRHVLWLGIEPATLWYTGQHWIHWPTPARASFLKHVYLLPFLGSLSLSLSLSIATSKYTHTSTHRRVWMRVGLGVMWGQAAWNSVLGTVNSIYCTKGPGQEYRGTVEAAALHRSTLLCSLNLCYTILLSQVWIKYSF